jgi:Sulfotransferase domain
MKDSVGEVFSWRRWKYVAWADPDMAGPLYRMVGVTLKLFWDNGNYSEDSKTKQQYLEHNERVRKVCPPERLLEFKLGSGWEPLCEFLGKGEVPEGPFPKVNDKNMFIMFHKAILDRATIFAVQKVLLGVVPVGIVAGAAWYWQRFAS